MDTENLSNEIFVQIGDEVIQLQGQELETFIADRTALQAEIAAANELLTAEETAKQQAFNDAVAAAVAAALAAQQTPAE